MSGVLESEIAGEVEALLADAGADRRS